ncbi:MAG: DUF2877 domain-containing protein [Acidobacteria bacterium]|nr:DUF2877 domain-containing protein [Acidobacteriota bacterium]
MAPSPASDATFTAARRPAWELLQRHPREVVGRLGILSSELEAKIECEGSDLFAVLAPVWERGRSVIEALALGDVGRLEASALDLVGLGAGSTPAGDDYLVGAFYALWARSDADWLAGPVEIVAPNTTTPSAAWLRAAARGEASPTWRYLIEALGVGHSDQAVRRATLEVLECGATSGAASIAGFVDLAELLFEGGSAQLLVARRALRRWPPPTRPAGKPEKG